MKLKKKKEYLYKEEGDSCVMVQLYFSSFSLKVFVVVVIKAVKYNSS